MLVATFDILMCVSALNAIAGSKREFVMPVEGLVRKNNKHDPNHREDSKRNRRCTWFLSVP